MKNENTAAAAIIADALKIEPARAARIADLFEAEDLPLIFSMRGNPLGPLLFSRLIELRRMKSAIENLTRQYDAFQFDLDATEGEAEGWGRRLEMSAQIERARIDTTEQFTDKPNRTVANVFTPDGSNPPDLTTMNDIEVEPVGPTEPPKVDRQPTKPAARMDAFKPSGDGPQPGMTKRRTEPKPTEGDNSKDEGVEPCDC